MSLAVHLALDFHVFIAVAVMVMVCGHHGLWPSWYRPFQTFSAAIQTVRTGTRRKGWL